MQTEPSAAGKVLAVLTGKAVAYTRPGSTSAIAKRPVSAAVHCGPLGFEGDEQADRRVHGGSVKAVHLYSFDHYPWWREQLGSIEKLGTFGAFGENLAVSGQTEHTVCQADQYQVGEAILEVSQGRQPCWKLSDHLGVPDMVKRVQQTRRAGWYCRVLKPGRIQAGDSLSLIERPFPNWTLDRLLRVIFEPITPIEEVQECLQIPLPDSWRKLLESRVEKIGGRS